MKCCENQHEKNTANTPQLTNLVCHWIKQCGVWIRLINTHGACPSEHRKVELCALVLSLLFDPVPNHMFASRLFSGGRRFSTDGGLSVQEVTPGGSGPRQLEPRLCGSSGALSVHQSPLVSGLDHTKHKGRRILLRRKGELSSTAVVKWWSKVAAQRSRLDVGNLSPFYESIVLLVALCIFTCFCVCMYALCWKLKWLFHTISAILIVVSEITRARVWW